MTPKTKPQVCRSETVRRLLRASARTLAAASLSQDVSTKVRRAIRALDTKLKSAEAFFQNRDCGCASQAQGDDLRFACTSESLAAEVLLAADAVREKIQRHRQRLAMALEQCQIAERLSIHPKQSARAFELHGQIVSGLRAVDALSKSLPGIRGRALTCLKQANAPAESPLLSRVA